MIGYLKGILYRKKPGNLILMVNNIGYEVHVSLQSFQGLKPEGEEEELFIYTIHKEDTFNLYGFKTEEEKELFEILISISGIGPKMGLTILSKIDTATFKQAVSEQNISLLTSVGGIGKKRAEKLLFELKEKFKGIADFDRAVSSGGVSSIQQDAILALESLGYNKSEAMTLVGKISYDDSLTLEELIKKALSA